MVTTTGKAETSIFIQFMYNDYVFSLRNMSKFKFQLAKIHVYILCMCERAHGHTYINAIIWRIDYDTYQYISVFYIVTNTYQCINLFYRATVLTSKNSLEDLYPDRIYWQANSVNPRDP